MSETPTPVIKETTRLPSLKDKHELEPIRIEHYRTALPEVIKDRPELLQTLLWDIKNNPHDIELMLSEMAAKLTPHDRVVEGMDPLEAWDIVLKVLGATDKSPEIGPPELGFEIFHQLSAEKNQEAKPEKGPFKDELLQSEKVWENVRLVEMEVVEEQLKGVEKNKSKKKFLVFEFSHKKWASISKKAEESEEERVMRRAISIALESRFRWGTNTLKDKKYQMWVMVDDSLPQKMQEAFGTVGKNWQDALRSEQGINKSAMVKGFNDGRGQTRFKTFDEIEEAIQIKSLLKPNTIIVNFDHGWCGDSEVSTLIGQMIYDAHRSIKRAIAFKRNAIEARVYDGVVGITSDNMGIVRSRSTPEPKTQNPNSSTGGWRNLRDQDPPYSQKDYAREKFIKLHDVFGVLGTHPEGSELKIIDVGWSKGGQAEIEFEAIVYDYAVRYWRETQRQNLSSIQKKDDKSNRLNGNSNPPLESGTDREVGVEITALEDELEVQRVLFLFPTLQQLYESGLPDLVTLRLAPADSACTFLGQVNPLDSSGVELLSFISKHYVLLGGVLGDLGLKRTKAGYSFIKKAGEIYTGQILPSALETRVFLRELKNPRFRKAAFLAASRILSSLQLDEIPELVYRAGKIHVMNNSNPINNEVVKDQTNGLIGYSGLTDYQKLLISKYSSRRSITFIGRWDRLVGFYGTTSIMAQRDSDELCLILNCGHDVSASRVMQEVFPYEWLYESSREQLDRSIEVWKEVAKLHLGRHGMSMRHLTTDDYFNATRSADYFHDDAKAYEEFRKLLFKLEEIYENNTIIKERIIIALNKLAGQSYVPREEDLFDEEKVS